MKVSVRWLRELCPVELDAERIASALTGVGFEVESRELRELPEGVVAARVRSRKPVEGSDHLSVCEVDDGAQQHQVVCGAQNYQAGDVVPLARVGAVLPGGQTIARARLRGVESAGMLCSARELGLSDDHAGLMILPRDVRLGTGLGELLGLPDWILDVNVPANRPDALSHLGIARELSALTGVALRPPPRAAPGGKREVDAAARVDVEEAAGCPRYVARVIEGVRVGPSPLHLQERLRSCGVRPISNVVDATNLALLELGHPLHAFDLDKLEGGRVVVRRARPGEVLATLDGKERTLAAGDLVIADAARPVALAGVMGGSASEVSAGTTRVLLESAVFDPGSVRRTARKHALHTEASHRFERGADERMADAAADRCVELLEQLAGGRALPGAIDRYPAPRPLARVAVRPSRVRAVLGADVAAPEVESRLRSLGLVPAGGTAERREWEVPSFRRDLTREIDCIEEVARQRGLDSIPVVLHPAGVGETAAPRPAALAARRAREALAAAGFDEVVNYSFVAEAELRALVPRTSGAEPDRPIRVSNPLTVEQGAMRTSLLVGLLRTLAFNRARGASDVRLYELGRVYLSRPDAAHPSGPLAWPAAEPRRLGLLALGRAAPRFWGRPGEARLDVYDLKGTVESLLGALRLGGAVFEPAPADVAPWLHPARAAAVRLPGAAPVLLGAFGELHPLVARHFDLPPGVLVAELDWEALEPRAHLLPQVAPVPRFPAVARDLAFVLDAGVPAARALAELRAADEKGLLESIELFDRYQGPQVAEGKKSLAFSLTLRAPDRTLTDAEADALCAAAAARLRASLGAELRV